jgi:integrase
MLRRSVPCRSAIKERPDGPDATRLDFPLRGCRGLPASRPRTGVAPEPIARAGAQGVRLGAVSGGAAGGPRPVSRREEAGVSAVPARAPRATVAERPTPAGEWALRQALGYIEKADAPDTRRAYASDWRHFHAWCLQVGLSPLPATPATLAAYPAAHAEVHAPATLRRRLAAIARVHREVRHAFDARDPAIRHALRGIAREHARPARQAAALTTAEIRALIRTCAPDLAGLRDRALLLLDYAGALRRSELVGVDVEHLRVHAEALEVLLPRSKGLSLPRGTSRIPSFLSSQIKEISQVGRADDHVNQLSKANRQGRRGGVHSSRPVMP